MAQVERIETARMVGTRLRLEDEAELARMHADPEVMHYLDGSLTPQGNRIGLDRQLAHWDAHGFGYWAWRDRGTNEFLGRGGLSHCVVNGRGEVELGYGFLPRYWGMGLATEMSLAVTELAFDNLGLADLACFCAMEHAASERVMRKAGFGFEGLVAHDGRPCVLYRRRAGETASAGRRPEHVWGRAA